jgi:anti-anti-sigma factor
LEIVKERSGDVLHVRVSGRLDNNWSEPFDEAIEEMIREGAHHLRLDLSGVTYLSSAGIGALMKAYNDTTNLQGSFVIAEASERVRTVLKMVSLDSLLFGSPSVEAVPRPRTEAPPQIQSDAALFDCYVLEAPRAECRLTGEPGKLAKGSYAAGDTSSVSIGSDVYSLGVGALGNSFEECQGLFGEFVAAAGTAVYMPTDGTSRPDYMMISGGLVPEVQALYAITFQGSPSHLLRFEASTPGTPVPLSEIVASCSTVAGTPDFGVVIAAEVSGLVCASLRRPPTQGEVARFEFPAVREWLSFLPEREFARTSSLVVGIASAAPSDAMRPFVRPVSDALQGHFHAVVTAFRSLPRGKVRVAEILAQAFQPRSVFSVVHLLRDSRPIEGAGESEFHRGACWVFPLSSIESGVPS